MLQDSVPAGSYNDPFLSSVCVSCGSTGDGRGREQTTKNKNPTKRCGEQQPLTKIEVKEAKRVSTLARCSFVVRPKAP